MKRRVFAVVVWQTIPCYKFNMLHFEQIVGAVHGLSPEEKLRLRSLLDEELKLQIAPAVNGSKPTSGLIGLFADEPELIDEIMESVYEHRSRPLRMDE